MRAHALELPVLTAASLGMHQRSAQPPLELASWWEESQGVLVEEAGVKASWGHSGGMLTSAYAPLRIWGQSGLKMGNKIQYMELPPDPPLLTTTHPQVPPSKCPYSPPHQLPPPKTTHQHLEPQHTFCHVRQQPKTVLYSK